MINLHQEIISQLEAQSLTEADIEWVGTKEYFIPIQTFLDLAKDVYYDQQAGTSEVALDLLIIGTNWGLRRLVKLDGSECWDFIVMPTKPTKERLDVDKFTIRECLDENGYRIFGGGNLLNEFNPEPPPE